MDSIKGLIFDYGGTIDTNGVHWSEVIWEQYCNAGTGIDKETFRDAYIHGERTLAMKPIIEPIDTFRTLLTKKIAIQFDYLRLNHCCEKLTTDMEKAVAEGCYARVLETIGKARTIIKELGKSYPMVLVTNFYGNMEVVLEEFGLNGIFKSIVESSIVGIRKPDPRLFALGTESLGMAPEDIVVIGDSYKKDIFPATTLGCKTVWIKNVCWEEEHITADHEPTFIINDISELPIVMEKFK